jgi:transketolase
MYIRLTGAPNNPVVYSEEYDFVIGKAITLREGSDVTIVANGTMVHESLEAAKLLEEQGISAAVVNMHTIKPLDTAVLDRAFAGSKLVVTVEEHSVVGGLGSAVAEYKAGVRNAPPQLILGLPDAFGVTAEYKYLLDKYGLLAPHIARRVAERFAEEKAAR